MSQNSLKVNELYDDLDETSMDAEAFDESLLKEEDLNLEQDDDLDLFQNINQRVLDATQLYLGEIGYSPLLTAEEEVFYARRALRGDAASLQRMIESNLRLVVKFLVAIVIVVLPYWI